MIDWLLVVGVKYEKWENEVQEVLATQATTQTPNFPDFEDIWQHVVGSSSSSLVDFDSEDLNNAIPQFPQSGDYT